MAKEIPSPQTWVGIDIKPICRNWFYDKTGANRRMLNRAVAYQRLASGINHLAGRCPRPTFMQLQLEGSGDAGGSNPLYYWRYDDRVDNGRKRVVRFLALPAVNYSGDAILLQRDVDGNNYANSASYSANAAYPAANYPEDLFWGEVLIDARPESGAPPGSNDVSDVEVVEGLGTTNGLTLIDVVVVDCELDRLSSRDYIGVDPSGAVTGAPILANIAERCRAVLHEIRGTNLPIDIMWAAHTTGGAWATPTSPGGATGMVVSVDTDGAENYVNLLDHDVTARTENSAGVSSHAQYCGTGDPTTDAGKQVKVLCRVFGATSAGDATNAYVKFVGPEHLGNNFSEILITANATPAWHGNSDHFVYLNPNAADTWTNVDRNKIDVFGKVSGAGESLYVYGLRGWRSL